MIDLATLRGEGPWNIPLSTPPAERKFVLDALAARAPLDPDVQAFAHRIAQAVGPAGPEGDRRLAAAALAAVQRLPYRDEGAGEWYQAPSRTLRVGGNCHDFAPLLVGVLRLFAIPAEVVWLPQPGELSDHVSVQVYLRGGWCWAETTVPGAVLCESPYAAAERLGYVHRLGVRSVGPSQHAPRLSADVAAPKPIVPMREVLARDRALVAADAPALTTRRQLVAGAPPAREPAPAAHTDAYHPLHWFLGRWPRP